MTAQLERLIRYDIWANREILGAMPTQATPPKSLKWLGHIIGAEYLWLGRMARASASLPVWPDLSLQDCAERLDEISPQLLETTAGMTPARLAEEIAYTNTKGEPWTSTIEDILIHLVIHSAYHRGQIAADLRAAGHGPAYTDYIHAVRHGLIE